MKLDNVWMLQLVHQVDFVVDVAEMLPWISILVKQLVNFDDLGRCLCWARLNLDL